MEGESLLSPVAAPVTNAAEAPAVTDQQDEPANQPEKTFTQADLDEIVEKRLARERRKAERIERQREIEEAERRGRESAQRQQQQPEAGPPKREDFESLEDYLEAKADWKVEQKLAERERAQSEKAREQEAAKRHQEVESTWSERVEKAHETYADFDDVVVRNSDLAISDTMAAAIKASEDGVDLAYYLGKNPGEAARIAKLGAVAQVLELGRLSATMKAQEKPVSKAAPPVEPVRGQSRSERSIYDADQMTTEQWIKMRNKQIGR